MICCVSIVYCMVPNDASSILMSFRNRRLASAVPKWMPLHDLCLRALLVSPQLFLRRDVRLILWEKDRWTDGQSRWPIMLRLEFWLNLKLLHFFCSVTCDLLYGKKTVGPRKHFKEALYSNVSCYRADATNTNGRAFYSNASCYRADARNTI